MITGNGHMAKISKSNLEVKGNMTSRGADRTGLLLGIAVIIGMTLFGTAAVIAAL